MHERKSPGGEAGRGRVPKVSPVNRALMVWFVYCASKLPKSRGAVSDGGPIPPFTTAVDAVVLGERVFQRSREIIQTAVDPLLSPEIVQARRVAEEMIRLLAATPGLQAVKGIVEDAESEAERFVRNLGENPGMNRAGVRKEFQAHVDFLGEKMEGYVDEGDGEGIRKREMPEFRTLRTQVSEIRKLLVEILDGWSD